MLLTLRAGCLVVVLLAACGAATPPPDGGPTRRAAASGDAAATRAVPAAREPTARSIGLAEAGLDPAALDRSVDPCVSLYRHACGGWVDTFTIPPDKVTFERTFSAASDATRERLRAILEEIPPDTSDPRSAKLGRFYRSCMDLAQIDARGIAPIGPWLARARAARTRAELAVVVGEVHPVIDAFFHFGPLDAGGGEVVARVSPGGVRGLVSDHDYVDPSPAKVALRRAYAEHAARMLRLAGLGDREAREAAEDALTVQIALAQIAESPRTKETMSVGGLERLAPGFPWAAFFRGVGYTGGRTVEVSSREGTAAFAALFARTDLRALRNYVTWRVVGDLAYVLGGAFQAERNTLESELWGPHAEEPRWAFCVGATRSTLRDLLTEAYVKRYLSPEAPEMFRTMFESFVKAFDDRMGELDWMDEPTRARARDKLAHIVATVGYPDTFRDHRFPVTPGRHAENVLAPILARSRERLAKAPSSPRAAPAAWRRSPLETNAWVDFEAHSVVFPAAFLKPPFLDPTATLPVRYGAIGFHLGHELTHHFDDTGAQYDAAGNRAAWWTPEAWRRFQDRTDCLVRQYAAYEPLPGIHVDAKRTLGENIADLGGLELAYRAYRAARAGAQDVTVADGYTEDQQFFLSYAQDHCVKFGEKDLEVFLARNVHAPHWLRVDGVVQNVEAFRRAFGCAAPAAPRCSVW